MWQTMNRSMQPMPSQIVPLVNVWNAPCQMAARLEKSIVPSPFMPLSRIVFPTDPSTIIRIRKKYVFAFKLAGEASWSIFRRS